LVDFKFEIVPGKAAEIIKIHQINFFYTLLYLELIHGMELVYSDRYYKVPFFDYKLSEYVEYGKIKLLLGEEYRLKTFRLACFSETLGCMYLITIGGGAAFGATHGIETPNLMIIASCFGFAVMAIAQFTGPLSGAHLNIAVSFALFLGGRISLIRCLCFGIAQLIGFVLGGSFVYAIFGQVGVNAWDATVFQDGQVFLGEMAGTILLIWVIFATIDIPEAGGGKLGVFPIAMAVTVAQLFLLPIDGCSINPTASLGTALVAAMSGKKGDYGKQQYMFFFAPMVGAIIAAIVYGKCYNAAIANSF